VSSARGEIIVEAELQCHRAGPLELGLLPSMEFVMPTISVRKDTANGQASNFSSAEIQEKTKRLNEASAAFGEIVSLLIRSPEHAQLRIADLEWILVPAVTNRQFLIVRAPSPHEVTPLPAAAILWASVSAEIHEMLKQDATKRHTLSVEQRKSGDIIWITDVIGDPLIWNRALDEMHKGMFKSHILAMARRAPDGQLSVIEHMPGE
jgi:hemolysin-activating ACP:hemolysin acyltransferase